MKIGPLYILKNAGHMEWHFSDAAKTPYVHIGEKIGCLVLHGFGGTPVNVRCVCEKLSNAGYTVYAPLLSGHASTLYDMKRCSDEIWLNDAYNAHKRLIDEGCKYIYIVGLSMGAIIASILAATVKCDGLVMISAPIIMKKYLYAAYALSPIIPYVLDGLEFRDNPDMEMYYGMASSKLMDLHRLILRSRCILSSIKCPTLVIYAGKDNRVSKRSPHYVMNQLVSAQSRRLILMPDAHHGVTYGKCRYECATHVFDFIINCQAAAISA